MTHTLANQTSQKAIQKLRLDQKLVTSLQILQMPVKELEQFLEEKLILNPLIPLELLESKELLLADLGIPLEDIGADPHAEELFWQSILQNETEKSPYLLSEESHVERNFSSSSTTKELLPFVKQGRDIEIDLFLFFQGNSWKTLSFQPFASLLEKTILAQKNLPETLQEKAPFWKELLAMQQALSSRKNLLIAIGKEIGASWDQLFQNGTISPLCLEKTASKLGRHRTTLYRAIKAKKIFTPRGILSLETLFEGRRKSKLRSKQAKDVV